MTAEGAEKSQQGHENFLQYNKCASKRSQVRTWGRQTSFLPCEPSNLVTPMLGNICGKNFTNQLLNRQKDKIQLGSKQLSPLEKKSKST